MKLKRSILALTFALVLTITSVYAWFEMQNSHQIDLETGVFEVDIDILFFNGVTYEPIDMIHYDSTTNLLELNAFNENEDNYINKLRVVMSVTAHTTARLRFRVQDEWRLIRTYYAGGTPTTIVLPYETLAGEISAYPFNVNSSFFSNHEDPYFYYDGLLEKDETLEMILIDGGLPYAVHSTENYYEEVYIRFQVFLDVVQANRIVEVWNVNADLFD